MQKLNVNTIIFNAFNPILLTRDFNVVKMTLDNHNICVSFFSFFFVIQMKVLNFLICVLFFMQATAEMFVWAFWIKEGLLISLLVWKGFYISQKYNFFMLKTNKQAQARGEKATQKLHNALGCFP